MFLPALATALVLVMASAAAYAQPTAADIFNSFNGLNGDQGFLYDVQTLGGMSNYQRLTTRSGSNPDTSAYYSGMGSSNSFLTFGVQPNNANIGTGGIATLNYDASAGTTTNKDGIALSYGAAFLYAKYATGVLVVTDDTAYDFYQALNTLNGTLSTNWNSNNFLYQLRTIESNMDYWTRTYNPGLIYTDIGNISVFILQLRDQTGNSSQQDVLYVANSTGPAAPPWDPNQPPQPPLPPSGVPEPASVVLWTLGCLGLTGTSWIRNRRMKRFALV